MNAWEWDETLYEGSAAHYRDGRLPYPPELPARLADRIKDGGRLLDIGCGPGNLTVMLAPLFAETVGVDADPGMIAEASRTTATSKGVTWLHRRAEQLTPQTVGRFDVITFGQSFHWMDQGWVRDHLRDLVTEHGCVVHVGAQTHAGDRGADELPHPRPPHDRIRRLVQRYLGEARRAGRGSVPDDIKHVEDQLFPAAGFTKEAVVVVKAGRVWERSEREVASAVLSLSSSAPKLFGDRFDDYTRDLHELLRETSDDGWFSERQRDVTLTVWRAEPEGSRAAPPAG